MDYRDERDALRARTEGLESELHEAREELERAREELQATRREPSVQARVEQLGRDLDAAQRELAALRGPRRKRKTLDVVILVGVSGFVVAGATAGLLLERAPARPLVRHLPAATASVVAPPVPPPAPPPAERTKATAKWGGRVTKASGLDLSPATPCAVEAALAGDGASVGVDSLKVTCGTHPLYRSDDELNGMAELSSSAQEDPGVTAGTFRYSVEWDDVGARSGARNQATVSSQGHTAVVWRDTAPVFRVELALDELSQGEATRALLAFHAGRPARCRAVARSGHVTEVVNDAALKVGAACEVAVRPVWRSASDDSCRVRVACGGSVYYGAGTQGYAELDHGSPTRIVDDKPSPEDQDPKLSIDLEALRVVVSDAAVTSWSVTLALDPRASP